MDALLVYRQPRVAAMLFLGFSAGLPFVLVFQSLSAWLRQSGIERATIGMLAWVGLLYSIKFVWAPIVDRLALPLLNRMLGRRRSWMLLAQIGIAFGTVESRPHRSRGQSHAVVLGALLVAFASATQDIALDAWRIETAPADQQGAMAAAYQLGYRIAIATGTAGAFWIAADHGWPMTYTSMAALMAIGIVTTLLVREPEARFAPEAQRREQRVVDWLERNAHWPAPLRKAGARFVDAVVCPLVDFFARYGVQAGHFDPGFHLHLPAHRLRHGRDGESVLHRRGIHAQGNRGGGEGARVGDGDPRRAAGRHGGGEARNDSRPGTRAAC